MDTLPGAGAAPVLPATEKTHPRETTPFHHRAAPSSISELAPPRAGEGCSRAPSSGQPPEALPPAVALCASGCWWTAPSERGWTAVSARSGFAVPIGACA